MAIVARVLRGEPLELVARETNVSIARLTEWRERALAGAATALKEREAVHSAAADRNALLSRVARAGRRTPSQTTEAPGFPGAAQWFKIG
jgi:hypothetical protein